MAKDYEDVEFKTIDGLVLRGWLFPAAKRGPAVVMTPGVSGYLRQFLCTIQSNIMATIIC